MAAWRRIPARPDPPDPAQPGAVERQARRGVGGLEGEGDASPAEAWLPTGPAGKGEHRPTPGFAGAGPAGTEGGRGAEAQPGKKGDRPTRDSAKAGPAGNNCPDPARLAAYSGQACSMPAQQGYNPA
jgi:hypothetical protein